MITPLHSKEGKMSFSLKWGVFIWKNPLKNIEYKKQGNERKKNAGKKTNCITHKKSTNVKRMNILKFINNPFLDNDHLVVKSLQLPQRQQLHFQELPILLSTRL